MAHRPGVSLRPRARDYSQPPSGEGFQAPDRASARRLTEKVVGSNEYNTDAYNYSYQHAGYGGGHGYVSGANANRPGTGQRVAPAGAYGAGEGSRMNYRGSPEGRQGSPEKFSENKGFYGRGGEYARQGTFHDDDGLELSLMQTSNQLAKMNAKADLLQGTAVGNVGMSKFQTKDTKLPFGWTKHKAEPGQGDQTFYFNRYTGESRWERPEEEGPDDINPGTFALTEEREKALELQRKLKEEEDRQIGAIEGNVTEGDGLHDVDEDYPDVVLFFILIYRYIRANYRRIKRQLKKAFEKQTDEEVMAMLMRENEAFVLTHMGAGVNQIQFVEPLEAERISQAERIRDTHLSQEELECSTVMYELPKLSDGFEKFRDWVVQISICLRNERTADFWIRQQWEKMNYQIQDKERAYGNPPTKIYSLEELQQDHGLKAYAIMERELRERIMDLCINKTKEYEKMGVKQRASVVSDVSTIRSTMGRLKSLRDELNEKAKDKKYLKKVVNQIDPTYTVKKR